MSSDYAQKLDLRVEMVPRGALIDALERVAGRRLTHEHRYYLANQPVHCGEILELCHSGSWVPGRFEWSGDPEERPVLYLDTGVVALDDMRRLRWPVR